MLRAGRLDRRVRIERRTLAKSTAGQVLEQWELVAEVFAQRVPGRGGEDVRGETPLSRTSLAYMIRYRDDVTAAMRVVEAGVAYDIVAVEQVGRREGLKLECEANQVRAGGR